eukprot:scaffold45510_cov39-Prasinocladus_malaysianus.AAC.1
MAKYMDAQHLAAQQAQATAAASLAKLQAQRQANTEVPCGASADVEQSAASTHSRRGMSPRRFRRRGSAGSSRSPTRSRSRSRSPLLAKQDDHDS